MLVSFPGVGFYVVMMKNALSAEPRMGYDALLMKVNKKPARGKPKIAVFNNYRKY